MRCYIDFAAGDAAAHAAEKKHFDELRGWLAANGAKYGLPATLEDLDESGRETLTAVYEGDTKVALTPASFSPPPSLLLPRCFFTLSSSAGLKKTTANFLALVTDEKQLKSKQRPNPPLRYRGCKVFRIDEGFVAQTGDCTRQDGSGGESIYGGAFNDEKEGLKVPFELGTVAMANSGKNSNTSQARCFSPLTLLPLRLSDRVLTATRLPQFFITLTSDPAKLKKLTGKYVAFGQVDLADDEASRACLDRLNALSDGKGGTREPVWIEACGMVAA
ncbi:hypothetical protein JCM10213_009261 [Rhodosporidiobolus nylandii]